MQKKVAKTTTAKTKKGKYNFSKEEIHALEKISKEHLTRERKDANKVLKDFKNMSISGDKKDK